jgi:hypothetical protein
MKGIKTMEKMTKKEQVLRARGTKELIEKIELRTPIRELIKKFESQAGCKLPAEYKKELLRLDDQKKTVVIRCPEAK